MSKRLPSPNPMEGSFSQFQADASQPLGQRPRNPRQEALTKLDASIPKTEEQWRMARQRNGFETPEDIHRTVSALVQDNLLPMDLRRLIYIAVCCVDYRKNEAEAYHKYRARVNTQGLTELTIRNYMSIVRGIVNLWDELYLLIGHRALEAFLLYAPLGLGLLALYKKDPEGVKACFSQSEVRTEVQASIALYLPSIVAARHPEYRYKLVCKVLGTSLLGEEKHQQFVAFLSEKQPIPRGLPDPTKPELPNSFASARESYDPIRNKWYPITIPGLIGYKPFPIQKLSQQLIATAGKQQYECARQEAPTAVVFRFKWSPNHHGIAANQVLKDLERAGMINAGVSVGMCSFFRHESGSMVIPNRWQQIIIPASPATETTTVLLSYQGKEDDRVWDCGQGFLFAPGTKLSTSKAILYFSIALHLSRS